MEQESKRLYPYPNWSYENCLKAAAECGAISRVDLRNKNRRAYHAACRHKWLDKLAGELKWSKIRKIKAKGFWNFENCLQAAAECNSKRDFRNKNPTACQIAYKNKWLDRITSELGWEELKRPKGFWNFENCLQAAAECNSRGDFQKKNGGAYQAAYKNKWLDKLAGELKCKWVEIRKPKVRRPNGYWTYENCLDAARKCNSRGGFQKTHQAAYQTARRNKWLDKITSELGWEELRKPKGNNNEK